MSVWTMANPGGRPRILIINPNSTATMTQGLRDLLEGPNGIANPDFEYAYMTGPPDAPASIDNEDDAAASFEACKRVLTEEVLGVYDGFVVACYSDHPLEGYLRAHPLLEGKEVLGILAASAIASVQAVSLQGPQKGYGIISTGKIWEELLPKAIAKVRAGERELGDRRGEIQTRFRGVHTTGLTAVELHDTDPGEVRRRMVEATKRLVKGGDVGAVCLGCAGMAGMDESVRAGCVEVLGEVEGGRVVIIDGVKSAVQILQNRLARR